MSRFPVTSFDQLRSWEGEQSRAFEDLSFQLLRKRVPIRTGNPDGGVEWYAVEPGGTERGWQAKHVHGIAALLTAMTESVKRVVKERPKLRTLTFVISWNLSTGKSGGERKSQREKFEDKVAFWKKTIPGADKITFELVQGSDLLDELAKPEHEGRRMFWWGDTVLGRDWLREHYQQQADAAGEKYRPDLQVDVSIQDDLLALGFDTGIREQMGRLVHEVVAGVAESRRHRPATPSSLYAAAVQAADRLAATTAGLDVQAGDPATVLEQLDARLDELLKAADPLIAQDRGSREARPSSDFHDLLAAARELSAWLGSSPGQALRRGPTR